MSLKKMKEKKNTSHLKQNFLPALTMSFNQHNLCYVAIFSKVNIICNSYIDISRKLNDNFFSLHAFKEKQQHQILRKTKKTINYFHFLKKKKKKNKKGEYRSHAKKEKVQNYFFIRQWLPGTSTI